MRLCLRLLQLDGVWGGTGAQGGGGEGEGIKNEGCHGVKACRFALRRSATVANQKFFRTPVRLDFLVNGRDNGSPTEAIDCRYLLGGLNNLRSRRTLRERTHKSFTFSTMYTSCCLHNY
jgi:hypothetical protein